MSYIITRIIYSCVSYGRLIPHFGVPTAIKNASARLGDKARVPEIRIKLCNSLMIEHKTFVPAEALETITVLKFITTFLRKLLHLTQNFSLEKTIKVANANNNEICKIVYKKHSNLFIDI